MDDATLLMTEKDAVKCARFAQPNHWFVQAEAELPDMFKYRLNKLVRGVSDG